MALPAEEQDDQRSYSVVVNDEEQYSVWLADSPVPAGWQPAGASGSKRECLAFIERTWTDIRPRSVRRPRAEPAPLTGPGQTP